MPETNLTGRSLKQYRLGARLGAGGMGEVYQARDTVLGRDAAVKVLPPDKLQDRDARQRFLREARAASALNHPSVVTVYEIGESDGIDFIAMELVEGETLQSLMRQRRLSVSETVGYAAQAADALAKAHAAGVVHRDIKPSNLAITPDGLAKVLDFGLARLNESTSAPASDDPTYTAHFATRAGMVLGTLAYMSPEQARGEEAGPASDVFSLGAVLFEMLSGQRPFGGTSDLSMLHNLHFSPPRDLRELAPDVPESLVQTVTQMLEKDPAARGTMAEVRQRLRGFAASETTQGLPSVEPRRNVRRRRTLVLTAAAVVAIVSGGFVLSRVDWSSGRRPPATPAGSASIDPNATPRDLYMNARALLDRFDREGNPVRAIPLLVRAVEVDPAFALGHAALTEAYHYRNQVAPDQQWLNLMAQSAQRAVTLNPELAAAHTAMGIALWDQKQLAAARASYRRAIDLDPRNPAPYLWMAVLTDTPKDQALDHLQRALSIEPNNWAVLLELGLLHYRGSNYAEATAAWEKARAASPDNVRVLANLAASYHMLDRHDDAASTLQRAIEIEPAPRLYANLGTLRYFQGRFDEAVAPLEKAVELAPNRYLYWANLGDAYRWSTGHKAKAAEAFASAIGMVRSELAKKPDDPDLQSRLALYLAKSGDTKAAIETLRPLERTAPKQGAALFRMAVAYEICGARDKALGALGRAIEAGYSEREIRNDPELLALRNDVRYYRLLPSASPATHKSGK